MADRRKVIPRQQKQAEPRQKKVVVPRWNVLSSRDDRMTFDVSQFRDATGRLDMEKVRAVARDYPGRRIEFAENRPGSSEYSGRSAFEIREAEKNLPPKKAPPKPAQQPRTDNAARAKKTAETLAREQKRKSEKTRARLDRTVKTLKKDSPQTVRARTKQVVARKAKGHATGAVWNRKVPLRPYQYVEFATDSRGVVRSTSLKRAQRWREVQALKKSREKERARMKQIAAREAKKREAENKVMRKLRQDRSKEWRRIRAREYARAKGARKRVSRQTAFLNTLSKAKGYGKTPLKLLLAKDRMKGVTGKQYAKMSGRRGALQNLPRSTLYPAMARGTGRGMKAPVSMRGVSGRLPLDTTERQPVIAGRQAQMFATTKTLRTAAFPQGGRGVIFLIDANTVLQNLTVRYPQILRETAISMSETMGRKLLDIVEPYVPKDTGLLYSTAQTNTSQMVGGQIGLAGSAFPASETFGVSISYNAPYAEIVYFDEDAAHGASYNSKHGVSLKGEKETAKWIEVAFEKETAAIDSLYAEYATAVTSALEKAGFSKVAFGRGAGAREFWKLG